MLRNIFSKHITHNVWKHTSPRNSSSSLIVTHDLDSRTGMDSMHIFASDEKERGIVATYNITTRYFDDELMSPFYNGNESSVDYIMDYGHAIGSHSVGHFFDFADDDIFPLGTQGSTQQNYQPFNDGDMTIGGTVWGECEVSRDILMDNHGADIRCFRAGHLAFHRKLINVLDSLGYEFNSNFASVDILTNFPFQSKYGRSFSGQRSGVMEIPVTISDVFHADPIGADNYTEKVDIWKKIFDQNDANGAVTTLLIHPNRIWKNTAQNMLFDQLPESTNIMEMGAYGDYWNDRKEFSFSSVLSNNKLIVQMDQEYTQKDEELSFIVKDGVDLDEITVISAQGEVLSFDQEQWKSNDVVVFVAAPVVNGTRKFSPIVEELNVYPNPTEDELYFELDVAIGSEFEIRILDVQGRVVRYYENDMNNNFLSSNSISVINLTGGVYFLNIRSNKMNRQARFLKN